MGVPIAQCDAEACSGEESKNPDPKHGDPGVLVLVHQVSPSDVSQLIRWLCAEGSKDLDIFEIFGDLLWTCVCQNGV